MPFRIQPYYPIPNLNIYKQNKTQEKDHIKMIAKSLSSRYCEYPLNHFYVLMTVLYT